MNPLFNNFLGLKKEVQKRTFDKLLNKEDKEKKEASENKKSKKVDKAYEFFYSNSAHIEIHRENRLNRVYFIILPFCHCLQKVF